MNFKEIITKEQEILKETDWYPLLKGFIYSKRFESVFAELIYDLNKGKHFAPTLKNIFKAFTTCSYENLNVILFNGNHEPLSYLDNNGLCYGNNTKNNSGQYYMLKSNIKSQLGNVLPRCEYGMEEYSKQGVLCLNNTLSFTENLNHDIEIWKPFFNYLFEMIPNKDNYVFVEIGDVDQNQFKNVIYVQSLLRKETSNGIFDTINKELERKNKQKIIW